jgi:hypothetical protein
VRDSACGSGDRAGSTDRTRIVKAAGRTMESVSLWDTHLRERHTLSIMYDVGGISSGLVKCEETHGVSRSSKQMPPNQISRFTIEAHRY